MFTIKQAHNESTPPASLPTTLSKVAHGIYSAIVTPPESSINDAENTKKKHITAAESTLSRLMNLDLELTETEATQLKQFLLFSGATGLTVGSLVFHQYGALAAVGGLLTQSGESATTENIGEIVPVTFGSSYKETLDKLTALLNQLNSDKNISKFNKAVSDIISGLNDNNLGRQVLSGFLKTINNMNRDGELKQGLFKPIIRLLEALTAICDPGYF